MQFVLIRLRQEKIHGSSLKTAAVDFISIAGHIKNGDHASRKNALISAAKPFVEGCGGSSDQTQKPNSSLNGLKNDERGLLSGFAIKRSLLPQCRKLLTPPPSAGLCNTASTRVIGTSKILIRYPQAGVTICKSIALSSRRAISASSTKICFGTITPSYRKQHPPLVICESYKDSSHRQSKQPSMTTLSKPSEHLVALKTFVTHAERQQLTEEASEQNMSRSELIRERALQSAFRMKRGSGVYAAAVEAACQSYSGVPRPQMEALVSAVIRSLDASTRDD